MEKYRKTWRSTRTLKSEHLKVPNFLCFLFSKISLRRKKRKERRMALPMDADGRKRSKTKFQDKLNLTTIVI